MVCSGQLSLLPFMGRESREMSSSIRATGWRPSMALHCMSNCSLARAMDGRVMRCGIIGSRQSAENFQDCKTASGHESDSCSKYPTFIFTFTNITCMLTAQRPGTARPQSSHQYWKCDEIKYSPSWRWFWSWKTSFFSWIFIQTRTTTKEIHSTNRNAEQTGQHIEQQWQRVRLKCNISKQHFTAKGD